MKTISRVAVVLIGMSSLASAQPKPAAPAAPAKPPAPDMAMMMKPPQELADMAKMSNGTWNCTGQGMDHSMKMTAMTGKLKMTSTMDGWWLNASFDSKIGKEPFRFESYTTFDAKSKRWKRVLIESGGGWATGESAGLVNNKVDWEMTSHSPMGDVAFRDHEDVSDPKAGAKMMGEGSMDGGKTWMKVYEMTCKK